MQVQSRTAARQSFCAWEIFTLLSSPRKPETGLKPTTRHYFEDFALKLAVALFAPLSVDRASWLMGKLWRHILPFKRRNRRTLANLAYLMPHLTATERLHIAADVRENFGRVFIEAFRLKDIASDDSRFDLAGTDALRALTETNNGCVIASLHQGNWETCSSAAMKLGFKPAGVYRELTNPLVEAYLLKTRTPFYPGGLFCKRPGSDIARRLLSIVKTGGTVAILGDLRDDNGVHLDFLGKPSSANAFPAFLARMTGRPLFAGRMVRTGGVRFRGEAERIEVPVTDDKQADIAEATRRLAAVFERWVRETPEQWLWTHRKWDLPEDRE
jgi:KDO2-lipid IV(A) lauroyltransferase